MKELEKGVKFSYEAFDRIEQLGSVGHLECGQGIRAGDVMAIYVRFLMAAHFDIGNFLDPNSGQMIQLERGEAISPMYKNREFAVLVQDALERIGLIQWRYAPGTDLRLAIIKVLDFETF